MKSNLFMATLGRSHLNLKYFEKLTSAQKRKAAKPVLKLLRVFWVQYDCIDDGIINQTDKNPGNYLVDNFCGGILNEILDFVIYELLGHPSPETPEGKELDVAFCLHDYYTEGFDHICVDGRQPVSCFIHYADWVLAYLRKHRKEPLDGRVDDELYRMFFRTKKQN